MYKEERFVINEEKGIVTCLLDINPDGALGAKLDKYLKACGLDETSYTDFKLFKTFVGVAKCNPNDNWDVQVGIQLSRERAEKNMYNAVNEDMRDYAARLRHAADLIENHGLYKKKNK